MRLATTISALLWLVSAPSSIIANPWSFTAPVDVTQVHGKAVFHHLGSGGRNAIAVSPAGSVAVVWEDNRDGEVRCYLGRLDGPKTTFQDIQISGSRSCYEPSVTAVGNDRFAVAWEEDSATWARIVKDDDLGQPLQISTSRASQAVITSISNNRLAAAWSQKSTNYAQIWVANLVFDEQGTIRIDQRKAIDEETPEGDQMYPDILSLKSNRVLLAWEDRRKGHTVILAAEGNDLLEFSGPQQVNESFWGGRALGYGRGTGAMRVSIASADGHQAIAVWADKRDFRSGYDVYAAMRNEETKEFGTNEKVQDGFADMVAQWHPEVAAVLLGTDSLIVSVWDDDREGTPDIWLSWRTANRWSDDLDVSGATGPGVQVEPAVSFSDDGSLHLAWVEKEHESGPSRIRYASGRRALTNAEQIDQ